MKNKIKSLTDNFFKSNWISKEVPLSSIYKLVKYIRNETKEEMIEDEIKWLQEFKIRRQIAYDSLLDKRIEKLNQELNKLKEEK